MTSVGQKSGKSTFGKSATKDEGCRAGSWWVRAEVQVCYSPRRGLSCQFWFRSLKTTASPTFPVIRIYYFRVSVLTGFWRVLAGSDGFWGPGAVRRLGLGLPGVPPTLLAQKIKKVKPLRLWGGQDLPILAVLTGFWRVLAGSEAGGRSVDLA